MRPFLIPALSVVLLAAAPLRADEVTDQIDEGRKLYEQGDVAGAVAELEFAIQAIRAKLAQAFLEAFPAPAAGWEVEPDAGAQGGTVPILGGNTVSRSYVQTGGTGRMEVQILSGGGFMQGLAQMLTNPQLMAMQPNARRVRVARETAVVSFDPADKSGQLVVDLGGKATFMIEGKGLAGPEPMSELAGRFDFKKARALAGL